MFEAAVFIIAIAALLYIVRFVFRAFLVAYGAKKFRDVEAMRREFRELHFPRGPALSHEVETAREVVFNGPLKDPRFTDAVALLYKVQELTQEQAAILTAAHMALTE
jgi:hypothetical protein